MKLTISNYCPSCKGGDLIFDYYTYQITCLSCKAIWVMNKKLMEINKEMENKIMICSLYQNNKCNATICDRQKPHEYDIRECNLLCEDMEDSKCELYNG